MNGTPDKVWGCVKPLAGTLRDQWDENVSSFEIVESITDVSLCERSYLGSHLPLELVSGSSWQGEDPANPWYPANTGCPLARSR